jgi:hypothetical protein
MQKFQPRRNLCMTQIAFVALTDYVIFLLSFLNIACVDNLIN